jgi:predicted AlkP superfamily phosphohydrolase/phosphomutase
MKLAIERNQKTIDELQKDIDKTQDELVEVKVHYLQKDDFSEFKEELWRKLEDIKAIVKHA